MTVYKSTIADLESAISNYRNGVTNLDAFKTSLWKASSEVVSVEEKELRSFLQQAEAELDSLQFTVDDDYLFDATIKVANQIQEFISKV